MKRLIAAAVLIATSTGVGLAQDAEKGAVVFKQCQVCHSIGPGAKNKIGPELNGLDGRPAGTVPNFDYSDANKHSGIVWNEENFKEYVKYPQGLCPRHQNDLPRPQEPAAGQRPMGLRQAVRRQRAY